jgi:hypothetical protein
MKKALTSLSRFPMWILIILTMLASQEVSQAQTFTDTFTFSSSSWSSVLLPPSTTGSSFTPTLDTVNGNLAPSRKTVHTFPAGQIFVGHLNSAAFYDPASQGAIIKLSYSYDLRRYNPSAAGVIYSILVFQNNTYYRSFPVDQVFIDSWNPFGSNNLTAADFFNVTGSNEHPDFSCKGSIIQFGYVIVDSNNQVTTKTTGIDNWTVKIEEKKLCGTASCGTISDSKVTCDKGTFTYTFTVTNNSTQVIQYLLLSPPPGATYTFSPNVIDLGATPLSNGQSTTVSVVVSNANSGDKICVNVALADKSVVTCCTLQTCVDLPDCSCLKLAYKTGCFVNGIYTLPVSLQNLTGVPVQQIFIIPTLPSNLNISPQLVILPTPLLPNQTTILTVTINGASPGAKICLRFSPLGDNAATCCSTEICLTLPTCSAAISPPMNPKKLKLTSQIKRTKPNKSLDASGGSVFLN